MARSLGRRSTAQYRVKWNITVPATLAAIIENAFWSPALGKPIYGKRNNLVVDLLTKWAVDQGLLALGGIPSTELVAAPDEAEAATPEHVA